MLRVDPITKRLLVNASGISTTLVVGTTPITSGTNGFILYDNNGILGELNPSSFTNYWQLTGSTLSPTGAYDVDLVAGCPHCHAQYSADDICPECEKLIKGSCYYCKMD